MRVALVTATAARSLDTDLAPLIDALVAQGIDAETPVWDDPAVDWSAFDVTVVRSTWDYAARHRDFLVWVDTVASLTALWNPADVLRWGLDKRYLRDLGAAGVPVAPTLFFTPGDPVHLPPIEVVVKPSISSGSLDTARYAPTERTAALAHVERLVAEGRVAMVQPYLHGVDQLGETGVVWIGGEVSHAFRKGPILAEAPAYVDGLYAQEDIQARVPSAEELAVVEAAVRAVPGGPGRLLYARVDLVPGPEGTPVVLELEVVEPSLFVEHGDGASERFAAAVAALDPGSRR